MGTEETKEQQQIYNIFRSCIYVFLIIELVMNLPYHATNRVVAFILDLVYRFQIFNSVLSCKVFELVCVAVTCIGTKAKKSLKFNIRTMVLYPIIAALSMLIFSDKSMQQLEYERGLGKPGRNRPAWLRTPLCAAFATAVYEIVNIAYVYLRGSPIEFSHIVRGLTDILLTAVLSLALMVPLRRFFGIRAARNPNRNLRPEPYRRNS
jgi:hypothetical protein